MAQTLKEQILEISEAWGGKEYTEHMRRNVPGIVRDLAVKVFERLQYDAFPGDEHWYIGDTWEVRVIKRAYELVSKMDLRDNSPGIDK